MGPLQVVIIGLVWVLPIYVAHQIGRPKNRSGFAWGLFLGWLGVIVVALLPQTEPPVARQGKGGKVKLAKPGLTRLPLAMDRVGSEAAPELLDGPAGEGLDRLEPAPEVKPPPRDLDAV